jgi:hypothetical protein
MEKTVDVMIPVEFKAAAALERAIGWRGASDVGVDQGAFGSPLSCHLRLATREQGGKIVVDKVADTLNRQVGCWI